MQINAGVKKDTVTAFAYHEDTADHLESDAIKSEPATSTINLNQVRELSFSQVGQRSWDIARTCRAQWPSLVAVVVVRSA